MDAKTTREIMKLGNKAVKAHVTYRNAKAANRQPIQSPREVAALDKYRAARAELDTACQKAGIATPKTTGLLPGEFSF